MEKRANYTQKSMEKREFSLYFSCRHAILIGIKSEEDLKMIIERSLIQKMIQWKNESDRKPLILNGVRQCGKTWLLKHFGQQCFEDVAYFNFEYDKEILSFFEVSYDPARIITQLSAFIDKQILPQKTLVIFD